MDRIKEIENNINTCTNTYVERLGFLRDIEYLLEEIKKYREALDRAHVQLDKYEAIIDLDVIEENKRLREAIHYLKGSAYAVYLYALHTIRSKTEIDIDKVIDKTDDMCKFAQRALREES